MHKLYIKIKFYIRVDKLFQDALRIFNGEVQEEDPKLKGKGSMIFYILKYNYILILMFNFIARLIAPVKG